MEGQSLDECRDEVETEFGQLLIVDDNKSFLDARRKCLFNGGILPPLRDEAFIKNISSYLTDCIKTDGKGRYVNSRGLRTWRIGLTTHSGKGLWSDGEAFNRSRDCQLFIENPPAHYHIPCENGFLYPNYNKLINLDCNIQSPYLCLVDSSTQAEDVYEALLIAFIQTVIIFGFCYVLVRLCSLIWCWERRRKYEVVDARPALVNREDIGSEMGFLLHDHPFVVDLPSSPSRTKQC